MPAQDKPYVIQAQKRSLIVPYPNDSPVLLKNLTRQLSGLELILTSVLAARLCSRGHQRRPGDRRHRRRDRWGNGCIRAKSAAISTANSSTGSVETGGSTVAIATRKAWSCHYLGGTLHREFAINKDCLDPLDGDRCSAVAQS